MTVTWPDITAGLSEGAKSPVHSANGIREDHPFREGGAGGAKSGVRRATNLYVRRKDQRRIHPGVGRPAIL